MSGAAVIEALRAEQRTMHVPIVVVSARTTVADHTLALSAGADAFFEKPIKLKALDDELRRLWAARTTR
jgi:DNA-binding response OmpR family regulator